MERPLAAPGRGLDGASSALLSSSDSCPDAVELLDVVQDRNLWKEVWAYCDSETFKILQEGLQGPPAPAPALTDEESEAPGRQRPAGLQPVAVEGRPGVSGHSSHSFTFVSWTEGETLPSPESSSLEWWRLTGPA